MKSVCIAETCGRFAESKGLCNAHYKRLRRIGRSDGLRQLIDCSEMRLCSIDSCERKHYANGYCELHYKRNKNGTDMGFTRSHYMTYVAIHSRLTKEYGTAPSCIWDDTHKGKRFEWANVSGEYTDDLEDYLPMCVPCHRRFDTTEETRKKISKRSMGNSYAKRSPVKQYLDNKLIGVYESLHDAERKTGVSNAQICAYLNGHVMTAGGFRWERV